MRFHLRPAFAVLTALLSPFFCVAPSVAQTVRVETAQPTNTFIPNQALGAGIDRIQSAAVDKYFAPDAVSKILTAGWQPVTYRQNTELFVEAWHWNPQGTWSDNNQGYFTGNTSLADPIRHSYGYPLPHRGFTRNDGTGTNGYSRLTDGDLNTYWKSNPYLAKKFTGEDDSLHPQWLVIDLASVQMINALRIAWADPYAKKYLVQYWTGDDPIKAQNRGTWVTFPGGEITDGKGGTVTLQLSRTPMAVKFLRVWMTESANTCDTHGVRDQRNCVGYAIRELSIGTLSPEGKLHDLVRHTPDQDQTATYCSSVDPWHAATDLGPTNREQVGLDLFYTSGYTRGLPAMVPIAMIYNIPEDAAAELAYLKKRGYAIGYVEMGEEPDGQYMLPEDYAALYLQFASAIHKIDPALKLGGPVFQGVNEDIQVWPDSSGKASWTGRFIDYLRAHQRLSDLAFFAYEHYPFEPCKISWSNLYDEPSLVSHIGQVWRDDGVPKDVPLFITESNIAWNSGESFVDIFGALWLADYVGAFFTSGGKGLYYFHYLPMGLHKGCNDSMGTFGMWTADANYQIGAPTSQFFASQLINLDWVQSGSGEHKVFAANGDIDDPVGHSLVTAYALLRPDGQWSLMLVNRDQENAHKIDIVFHDQEDGVDRFFTGPVSARTFGSAQYQWHPTENGGHADPDGPAVNSSLTAMPGTVYELPRASMTVLLGHIAPDPANTRRKRSGD